MKLKLKISFFVLLLSGLLGTSSALANEAFSLNGVNDFRNSTWAFGVVFTVGDAPIIVDSLGAYDAGNNGFVTAGGLPAGMYRESDGVLLASTTVTSADPLIDRFRYGAITPILLEANTTYRVVTVNRDDLYNNTVTLGTDPAVTFIDNTWVHSNNLVFDDISPSQERLYMSNFQFTENIYTCIDPFDPPFDAPLTLKPKKNGAIPVKMQLYDFEGFLVIEADLDARPVVNVTFAPSNGDPSEDVTDDLLPIGQANDDNIFRYDFDEDKFIYNLSSKPYKAPGDYTVSAVAGDSSYVIEGCSQTLTRQ